MRAILISEWGGPEVLELVEDAPVPEPSGEQVLVHVTRAGINFADTHARENSYLARYELPLTPGTEIAGVVERDGAGFEAGQRVVAMTGTGGYAEYAAAPAAATFPIPDGVSDAAALALLIQGLTAWHLYKTSAQLRPRESVVVHAAAGGVGSIAVQLGRPFGAGRVIATASSEDKRELALKLGADAAVDVTRDDLADGLREANEGKPVDAVLEMTGGETFEACLRTLAPFGRHVVFGIASRERNQVDTGHLLRHSRSVIGFWLMHLIPHRDEVAAMIADLLGAVAAGELEVIVGDVYPLSEARRAHEDIAARRTSGKLLLDPSL